MNTDHLIAGTQADNMQDMVQRGRSHKPNLNREKCGRGHEFTPENTSYQKTSHGSTHMICRACKREDYHRYKKTGRTRK